MALTDAQVKKLDELLRPMDGAELEEVYLRFKVYSDQAMQRAAMNFCVGDRVTFIGRGGIPQKGTVASLTRGSKSVHVKVDNGIGWRVAASLLTKIK